MESRDRKRLSEPSVVKVAEVAKRVSQTAAIVADACTVAEFAAHLFSSGDGKKRKGPSAAEKARSFRDLALLVKNGANAFERVALHVEDANGD